MKKSHVLIIAIIVVIIALVLLFAPKSKLEGKKNVANIVETVPAPLTNNQSSQIQAGEVAHKPTTLTFDVVGGNYYFTPSIIKVKKGDTVKINFKNNDGFHDFKIDELNVATSRIKSGSEVSVSFLADKAGTFEYYCSVGTHRLMGMKGTLIIE